MRRNAEGVAADRQRILDRTTISPALPDAIESAVVGLTFVDDYPANVRRLERYMVERFWTAGADAEPIPLVLVRNPANTFDANAVEVHSPSAVGMIGHLPRKVAAAVAPEIDAEIDWRCDLIAVRTHPDHVDNPGIDVRLTRVQVSPEAHADPVEAVIAESVAERGWAEVNFELATRDLPVPEGLPAMRAALISVLIAERDALMERTKEWQ